MRQLISCVLSFALIFSSVTPAAAQLVNGARKLPQALGKVNRARVPQVGVSDAVAGNVMRNMRMPLTLQHSALLTASSFVPAPRQIVTHANLAERALLLRSDFAVYGLTQKVQPADMAQAVSFYREGLQRPDEALAVARLAAQDPAAANLAGTVADISSLGLFGSAQTDAPQILAVYKKSVGTVSEPLITTAAARALLRLGAYEELQQMAHISTQQPALWDGIATYAKDNHLPLTLEDKPRTAVDVTGLQTVFQELSPLHALALTQDAGATFLYMNAGRPATAAPQQEVARAAVSTRKPVEQPVAEAMQPEVPQPPVAAPQPVAESPVVTPAPVAPAEQPAEVTPPSTNGGMIFSSFVPIPTRLFQWVGDWISSLGNRPNSAQAANKNAQSVLAKPQPMLSQLRDIVLGDAAVKYKSQALLKLYNQGVFASFLKKQPKAVRNSVVNAANDAARADALLRLYQTKYLDGVLQGISDIQEQGSVLADLQDMLSQDNWNELARSAYEAEDVLPLANENFSGAVSSVPKADPDKIVGTVRPVGYATENVGTGITTKKGIYYKNNIPFYYRNSRGELSSQPVGILTQIPANLYGRLLSAMRLASQPGLTIPEGFVLALDEQGQWKFFIPKGNLSVVEANPYSTKTLQQINKSGSARVILDTPYSTTDLLAMAHLLEHNPNINLELTLNTPHSLKQFLTGHALFVGNDAGNTLTGPFKDSLKALRGFANTMANLVSGVGYMTPIAGGYAMPTMSRWGNVKTTKVIYGMAAAALAGSFAFLGMNGTVDPSSLPLWGLAIPTVALVLGASLANSFIPTFLNFYKDPAARTAANLEFSTMKQVSRLSLSGITAAAGLMGGNWTVVVPVGLTLLAASYGLFLNTPMYKEEAARLAAAKKAAEAEQARWNSLTPEQQAAEQKAAAEAAAKAKVQNDQFVADYKKFRNAQAEMKASKSRVKMVYASYAASLMVLGQSANAAFGDIGQGFITLCMAATLGTRLLATRLVKKNTMTDDQLTGLSLPTLALTGLALGLLPYSGAAALVAGAAGILHYMATAVPGQLDAARMQNIVTAEMQQRKQQVLNDASLSEAEKEAQVAKLTAEEKVWSAQASKDYSLYNARGLWGIGAATGAALLFADLGPQWTQDLLTWISDVYGGDASSLSLNRLLFLYSGTLATILAAKNLDLTADGFRFFRKKMAITDQAISEHKITPKQFGINAKNAQIQLGNITGKSMKEVEPMLVEYGVSSEQKMTNILQQLQSIHNRLVAVSELLGPDAVRAGFEREAAMVQKFATILGQNDLSVMLRREFEKLQNGLLQAGTQNLLAQPRYVEEGLYKLPEQYKAYETARMVIGEMDQMVYSVSSGKQIDYQQFVNYMTRARENLLTYEKANPADSIRVVMLRRQLTNLCTSLAEMDAQKGILNPEEVDSKQIKKGKQALRDMLVGYSVQDEPLP